MENITIGIAFISGILSFLSPCVLPLIPGYISFLSGLSMDELRQKGHNRGVVLKSGITSIFFVAGFSAVFTALGASASFIGKALETHIFVLTKAAGILIIVLGIHLTGIFRIRWLSYERRMDTRRFSPGILSAFFVGVAFAFGWTPCVGPILAGILALAAAQGTVIKGIILLGIYSLGLGIPFIAAGFFVGVFIRFFQRYKRFIHIGEILAGVLLIAIGILIFTGNISILTRFLPGFFYRFAK